MHNKNNVQNVFRWEWQNNALNMQCKFFPSSTGYFWIYQIIHTWGGDIILHCHQPTMAFLAFSALTYQRYDKKKKREKEEKKG